MYSYTHVHAYICIHIHMRKCIHVYMYMYILMYIVIYTCNRSRSYCTDMPAIISICLHTYAYA